MTKIDLNDLSLLISTSHHESHVIVCTVSWENRLTLALCYISGALHEGYFEQFSFSLYGGKEKSTSSCEHDHPTDLFIKVYFRQYTSATHAPKLSVIFPIRFPQILCLGSGFVSMYAIAQYLFRKIIAAVL